MDNEMKLDAIKSPLVAAKLDAIKPHLVAAGLDAVKPTSGGGDCGRLPLAGKDMKHG